MTKTFYRGLFWALVGATLIKGVQEAVANRTGRAEQRTENEKCALRGLVLLRGQMGEYVCVVPGSERHRSKP
jgi:hypothetical protein